MAARVKLKVKSSTRTGSGSTSAQGRASSRSTARTSPRRPNPYARNIKRKKSRRVSLNDTPLGRLEIGWRVRVKYRWGDFIITGPKGAKKVKCPVMRAEGEISWLDRYNMVVELDSGKKVIIPFGCVRKRSWLSINP